MSGFEMRTVTGVDSSTMILSGEADLAVAEEIVRQGTEVLSSAATQCLIVDLGAVTFIDSTTLGALIQLRNVALAANKQVQLMRLPSRVRRVLEIAGLAGVFDEASPNSDF
jgi:anti-sigma B factor antagonist